MSDKEIINAFHKYIDNLVKTLSEEDMLEVTCDCAQCRAIDEYDL